jgi:hypothetical protein
VRAAESDPIVLSEVEPEEPDELQTLLAAKRAKTAAAEEMRARVASEVDEMMDNGVRINPLLRQMYGERTAGAAEGEGEGDAAAAPPSPQPPASLSPAGATKRKASAPPSPRPSPAKAAAVEPPAANKRGRVILDSDDED